TTSFLNSGVYRLFGIPFGIKITPPVRHYIILSNKWGAVHVQDFAVFVCIFRLHREATQKVFDRPFFKKVAGS
ncbi:hypothetical protein, partial [Hominenteromicrobium sp.]|uniref:hypothetical protein n=1 Tax=Hominenteromicrobium sp. TaxID=3073581 RepID=UPI003AB8066A